MSDLKTISILFRAYDAILQNAKSSLKEVDLNFNEFMILEALYHKGSMSTKALADRILVPSSSLSYNIKKLKERNLIIAKTCPEDRRIQSLSLSPKAHHRFLPVYAVHVEHMRKILDVLEADEEASLQTQLKKIGYEAERILKK